MPVSPFAELLNDWEHQRRLQRQRVMRSVSLYDTDTVKIKALADVFNLPEQEIIASLLHQGLFELESQMPGDIGHAATRGPLLQGAGLMPRYIERIREITRGG